MTLVPLRGLRVEEPAAPATESVAGPSTSVAVGSVVQDLDYWRKLAIQAGQRLQHVEDQAKALRREADEARSRFGKYKDRLDSANARNNDLQAQVVLLSAEVEAMKGRLAQQDVVKQKVWEIRQAMLDGPLFELFGEYCK